MQTMASLYKIHGALSHDHICGGEKDARGDPNRRPYRGQITSGPDQVQRASSISVKESDNLPSPQVADKNVEMKGWR